MKSTLIMSALSALLIAGNASAMAGKPPSSTLEVVPAGEIQWGMLNPARGDQSPKATDLWGDRTKDVPTGMLVKFDKGFSSPPHIHNITYRGIVIEGFMHNDDPTAAKMWLPAGSYWMQPAGEDHITAANGENNMIFLEIDSGPYLVQPSSEAFDNGERPVNIDAGNLVWQTENEMNWVKANGAEIALLWGKPNSGKNFGAMVKLPKNFKGSIGTDANEFKAIVIKGALNYTEGKETKELKPGSYVGSSGKIKHQFTASSTDETLVYIRADGQYKVKN